MSKSSTINKELLQDRFALKTASHLTAGVADLPHDIAVRLRVARLQAVAALGPVKKRAVVQSSSQIDGPILTWGDEKGGQAWSLFASFFPLVLLVVGLLFINTIQRDNRATEVADVDLALLTDALPPAAFSDPGFVQFLKGTP